MQKIYVKMSAHFIRLVDSLNAPFAHGWIASEVIVETHHHPRHLDNLIRVITFHASHNDDATTMIDGVRYVS